MATFGETGTGDGAHVGPKNDQKWGSIFTLTEQGQITKISVRMRAPWGGTCLAKAGIYSVSGGEPSGLEIECEEKTITDTMQYWDWTGGDLPKTLAAGDYWIGVIIEGSGSQAIRRQSATGDKIKWNSDDYTDGFADPFGTANNITDMHACANATYTPGGGQTYTKTYNADALLKKSDIVKTYSSDALLQKQGITKTYSADLLLLKTFPKTYPVDVLLKKTDITKTYESDVLLQKQGITKTYVADLLLLRSLTKIYSSDVLLKKLGITKTYTADVILGKVWTGVIASSLSLLRRGMDLDLHEIEQEIESLERKMKMELVVE